MISLSHWDFHAIFPILHTHTHKSACLLRYCFQLLWIIKWINVYPKRKYNVFSVLKVIFVLSFKYNWECLAMLNTLSECDFRILSHFFFLSFFFRFACFFSSLLLLTVFPFSLKYIFSTWFYYSAVIIFFFF